MTEPLNAPLEVVEEQLRIGKELVRTGRVRVATETDLVEETASVLLARDTVEVVRVPIDREVDEMPEMRTEGEVTIIPVVEEVLYVAKRLVLKEELHVRRQVTEEQVDVPVTLRKQRAVIERLNEAEPNSTEEDNRHV